MSALIDDQIRLVLDRVRSAVTGLLDAELTASTSDILRAALDAQNQAVSHACERAIADARRESDDRLAAVQAELASERKQIQAKVEEIAGRDRALGELQNELAKVRLSVEEERRGRQSIERDLEQSRQNEGQSRKVAEEARDRSVSLSRELEEARRSIEQQSRALEEAQRGRQLIERDLEQSRQNEEQSRRAAEDSRETVMTLSRELEDARRSVEQQSRVLDETQRGRQLIERDLEQIRQNEDQSRRVAEDARKTVMSLGRELEDALRSAAQQSHALEDTRREMAELRRQTDSFRRESERARAELKTAAREIERMRARLVQTERLVTALHSLNEAATLGEILDTLARSACAANARTAVFLVQGDKLRAWRAVGFDGANSIEGADFDPELTGVVARAAQARAGQLHRNGDDRSLPVFARNNGPRNAVALPVEVGGSVIAVLYVDSHRTDNPEDAEWLQKVSAMAKQAGWALEAMTIRRAATLWISGAVGGSERPVGSRSVPSIGMS